MIYSLIHLLLSLAHRVESLREIYKYHEEVLMLFTAFLLYLSCCEYHVCSAPSRSESTLALGDDDVAVYMIVSIIRQ